MKDDKLSFRLRRKIQVLMFKVTSPEYVSRFYFKKFMKQKLNLKDPKTFNEKIQWLKLYEWPFNKDAIICSDKYLVHQYLKEKGYDEYLNDILYVWDKVDDIDWNALPKQFVLKCNHGCGYNIIISDKDKADEKYVKRHLKRWMKQKFGRYLGEIHYDKIKPMIICEKYLGDKISDYKVHCFNGKPLWLYISTGLDNWDEARMSFFNIDGEVAPFQRTDFKLYEEKPALPEKYDELIRISKELSKDFPFVRVDFFEIDGKLVFSEMTFTPCGGLMTITPKEYDLTLGNELDISDLIKKKQTK